MMKLARSQPTQTHARDYARWRQSFTVAVLALVAACSALATSPAARGQFDFDGGTIRTKDLGYGVLDVKYFNEQSAGGTGGCVHVEVSSPSGPSPRERNLEIVFYMTFNYGPSKDGTAYRFPVTLPEGARRAEVRIPYALPGPGHPGNQILVTLWDIGVSEDRRNIEANRSYSGSRTQVAPVSMPAGKPNAYHAMTSNVAALSMLRVIEDDVAPIALQPEMFRLLAAFNSGPNAAVTSTLIKTNFGISSDWTNVGNVRPLSTAPDKWQYYLQFHFVVLDEAVLKSMREKYPAVSAALKQYVAAGGSVLLLGSGRDGQELVDQWLGDAAFAQRGEASFGKRGDWQKLSPPVEVWWNRALTPQGAAPTSGQAQAVPTALPSGYNPGAYGNAAPYANPGPLAATGLAVTAPGTTAPVPPDAPSASTAPGFAPPSGTPVALPAVAPALQPSPGVPPASATQPAPANQPATLAIGGCVRDLLTVAQTYSMAEYGTPLAVADSVIDLFTGNGDSMAVSGIPMTPPSSAGFAAVAFEMDAVLEPLQERLERAVADIESQDTVGCSVRPYALGKVGLVQPALDVQPPESVRELTSDLGDSASLRINSAKDGAWLWRNLIGSVGKPPVWTFCAFVLLFGLLLGPGLLMFTGWMGRRSLLIFLVPCVSLIATLSIAAYEVLHEGFDTYIRISSVVTIDEPTGEGFAWSRQTYFSGWPPRDGLEFPNGVYFRPVTARREFYQSELSEPRNSVGSRIDVGQESVRWTGWLDARQQQQLLIGHPAKPAVPLRAERIDARHIRIKNLTSERLPFAAVRDDADGYYLAVDLMPGAEVECVAMPSSDIGVDLSRLRAKHLPAAPLELQGRWGWGRRSWAYAMDTSPDEVVDSAWHQYVSEFLVLPRYGFVTLQESPVAIYVPLKGKITESTQLVVGRLVW